MTLVTPVVGAGADPLARLGCHPVVLMGSVGARPELIAPDVLSRYAPHLETSVFFYFIYHWQYKKKELFSAKIFRNRAEMLDKDTRSLLLQCNNTNYIN